MTSPALTAGRGREGQAGEVPHDSRVLVFGLSAILNVLAQMLGWGGGRVETIRIARSRLSEGAHLECVGWSLVPPCTKGASP